MLARVVIINDLSKARGGATTLALLSARLLRERGIDVTFVSGDDGEGREALEALGVEVVSLGSRPLLERARVSAGLLGLYNPFAFRAVRSWIARNDGPGVVYHLHTWSRILSPSVFHALRPVAGRTMLHAHDYFLTCPNGQHFDFQRKASCTRRPLSARCVSKNCDKRSYTQKLWRSLRHLVRRLVFDFASLPSEVLMIHPTMRGQLRKAGFRPEALHMLRNPAEPFVGFRLVPERQKQFFMISRLDFEKGFADAAAAAREAGVPLTIIGEGAGRAFLEANFPEVRLLGWRSKAEIGEILAHARVVVMPTRGPEPFGMAAVEAASCGLPLILNDQANLAVEAVDGGFGLAFETASVSGLAAAMRQMADDDELVAAMSANAWAEAKRLGLGNQIWCDRLLDRYRAALLRDWSSRVAPGLRRELAS